MDGSSCNEADAGAHFLEKMALETEEKRDGSTLSTKSTDRPVGFLPVGTVDL